MVGDEERVSRGGKVEGKNNNAELLVGFQLSSGSFFSSGTGSNPPAPLQGWQRERR